MACDLVGINNREPRGENHRGIHAVQAGRVGLVAACWQCRTCMSVIPGPRLTRWGAKGTPRPVTCDLARKIGCARSAFVQTALAVLLRQPCRPVGQMLYQDSCISFTEQDFVDSPNPCRGITLDVSACRAGARRRWGMA